MAKRDEFINDWRAMIAAIAEFSVKYDLPKGELIFPPVVLDNLRDMSPLSRVPNTLIHRGIRVRFGGFEQAEAFRQYL